MTDRHPWTETGVTRTYSNLFCIWRLCGRVACLHARRCRGDAADCFDRCMPLLPDAVHDFVLDLEDAQKAGLTWGDVFERFPAEWRTMDQWHATVEESLPSHAKARKRGASPLAANSIVG